jgi:Family of unknown function (DUF5335)
MMKTQEIKREDWPSFLDAFTRRYRGWLADLEVFGPEMGSQTEEHELPFAGITAELGNGRPDKIEIMLGGEPDDHITHVITAPTDISVEKTDEGVEAALAIKAPDGTTTLLRFRAEPLPKMADAATQ